jgi:hypothetical protein
VTLVKPEIGDGASHVHHPLKALPYKKGIKRKDLKYYPPNYPPFELCCAPFWHWMERSTNGSF